MATAELTTTQQQEDDEIEDQVGRYFYPPPDVIFNGSDMMTVWDLVDMIYL
jgi:hypothetical protein